MTRLLLSLSFALFGVSVAMVLVEVGVVTEHVDTALISYLSGYIACLILTY